jgi:hypothetical protein
MQNQYDPPPSVTDVFDQLVAAIEEVKHAEWITPRGELHIELDELFQSLVAQLQAISEAAGPNAGPSIGAAGRPQRNIASEAHGDPKRAAALLAADLRDLQARLRDEVGALEARGPVESLIIDLDGHIAALGRLASSDTP